MSNHDDVSNPKHYDLFPDQQAIDVIQASLTAEEFAGYCKGNALKYRLRAGEKGDALKCIAKANWYQKKLREVSEERNGSWTDHAIKQAAFKPDCEYTLEQVIGDAVLSDFAQWVAVDEGGGVREYEYHPYRIPDGWIASGGKYSVLGRVVPPLNFTKCIWEIKK